MSFPTLQVRPNEKNPKVLRSHEFLRQSNQLVERNYISTIGRRELAKMLTKTVAEVKGFYALDEKRTELAKSGKLLEKLKAAHQTSMSVMEDRFVLADLARQVQEKKLAVQRKYYECDYLRKSVQSTNAEVRREKEVNEKRLTNTTKASDELMKKSVLILKLLENSTDVCKLRTMEEEKRVVEEEVEKLRDLKKNLADDIRTKKATLKAESKRSFKKSMIECAKHYKLCQSLTPKLEKSKKNLEALKEEEESRRACGSLDETMQFDRSFVLASMEKEKSPEKSARSPSSSGTPQKHGARHTSFNESIHEQQDMEVEEDRVEENVEMVAVSHNPPPVKVVLPSTSTEPPKRRESVMETQRVLPGDPSPEPEKEQEPEEHADRSIDVMELDQEEVDDDHMEQEEHEENEQPTVFRDLLNTKNVTDVSPAVSASSTTSITSQSKDTLQKPAAPVELDISDQAVGVQNNTVLKMDEDEVLSENGSNRSNNFSFNFFGNSKGGTSGEANGTSNDTDGNFDFNFGGGDDGSSNGSGGAFDFLNCGGEEEGQGTTNPASDPFGFGSNAGGTGGGDMSFNFNFDGDNEGGASSGAGGNSASFFNF